MDARRPSVPASTDPLRLSRLVLDNGNGMWLDRDMTNTEYEHFTNVGSRIARLHPAQRIRNANLWVESADEELYAAQQMLKAARELNHQGWIERAEESVREWRSELRYAEDELGRAITGEPVVAS